MRALITGIDGFVGRYLEGHLTDIGYEVFGISPPGASERGNILYGDIADKEFVAESVSTVSPDRIFHLAAISFAAHGNIEEIYEVNVMGTLNLYEALKKVNRDLRLLFISSSTAYGIVPKELQPMREDLPLRPVNHYAVSKASGELMSLIYSGGSVKTVIARPFNHTGVGQSLNFVVPKIVHAFAGKQTSIKLGNVDAYRDFSDVRDIVKAYAALLEKGPDGGVYNVCSGVVHSIRDVIGILRDISGHDVVIEQDYALLRNMDIPYVAGDNSKIGREVGWKPNIDFRETIKWMYDEDSH
jgi:nucleoside-diphosphate-sugar epimerase